MKFTKEDAYKELVAKMTTNGEKLNLSQRSMNEQIETLLPLLANEETEIDDFVSKILPLVKISDANVRNDVSQGIKDYKLQNPQQKQEPPKQNGDNTNDELLKRLEALENKNKIAEIEIRNNGLKNGLKAKLKEVGVKNEKWIDMMVGNVNITDDFNIETQANTYLELYNSMQADVDSNVTPGHAGGGKHDYISEAIKNAAQIAKQQTLIGS